MNRIPVHIKKMLDADENVVKVYKTYGTIRVLAGLLLFFGLTLIFYIDKEYSQEDKMMLVRPYYGL
jgi:hypothetical protein